ncbi:type I-E CRISPR-associated protein Cse2/CasB [Streptomyces anulatus]|uniref:type I-E CRISPR-associated protein Cse2/CasB n=1 Tax=Streptomyces anulatus TaxID=1892 RepID=UPI001C27B028|nr:type I-E CRISPR-associated protein Cse2/CasB [Streptomyces anulatus]
MSPGPEQPDPVPERVRSVAHTMLSSTHGRWSLARNRPALRRDLPPSEPALWMTLDLYRLHPEEAALDTPVFTRAATAVTAAAQLWARAGITHRATSPDHDTTLGAALARASRTSPSIQERFTRLLQSSTLDEIRTVLRPLLHQLPAGSRLDVSALAADFYTLQSPAGSRTVRQDWARAYTGTKARSRRTPTSESAHGKADPA